MQNEAEIETIQFCFLCQKSNGIIDRNHGRRLGLIPPYEVKLCKKCGLRWLSPRPTSSGYEKLYSYQNYFTVEDYTALANERRYYFKQRIKRIEHYLPDQKSLDILDIGAATGEFTHEALQRGHAAVGLEISQGAREKAYKNYGIKLEATPLEKFHPGKLFDSIHMNHVLEHLPNPPDALTACFNYLKPGGILVLEVPQQFYNDLDRLKKVLLLTKRPEFNAYSLHHTFFFTPHSIQALLVSLGFKLLDLKTANIARTPLYPFKIRNLFLLCFLYLADKVHRGGNIIEVYATKQK